MTGNTSTRPRTWSETKFVILKVLSPLVRNSPPSPQGVNVPTEKTIRHISDSFGFLLSSFNLFHKVPMPQRTLTRNFAQGILFHKEWSHWRWRSCDVQTDELYIYYVHCHDVNSLTFTSNDSFVLFGYFLLNNTIMQLLTKTSDYRHNLWSTSRIGLCWTVMGVTKLVGEATTERHFRLCYLIWSCHSDGCV